MSVELHPQYLFDESGEPQTVLLSYSEYLALLEELEDLTDSAILKGRLRNAGQPVPLRQVMQELDGIEE